jgi:transposase-like protein
VDCPKCGSKEHCKDGFIQGKQRYRCHGCDYHYTTQRRSGTASPETKRQALQKYLEGLGFRSIARILKFSNVAVLNWIRAFGEALPEVKNDKPVQVIEIDEMHSYIGSKKILAGYGLLLIDMNESSSTAYWVPGRPLQGKISGIELNTDLQAAS